MIGSEDREMIGSKERKKKREMTGSKEQEIIGNGLRRPESGKRTENDREQRMGKEREMVGNTDQNEFVNCSKTAG